ncbi:MAG TPA: ATP synthase F0 subunit A, partial [Dehalococcoidia bacterium]|nr:ATP synthase F0 subunit A [Dehalococcoidia bacterium]
IEGLIEAALSFCNSVLGPEMGRKAFPVVATIFFFVLFNAWLALLPFYQFMGFMKDGEIKAH